MPRVPFVCGNWKMHKTVGETVALIDGILAGASTLEGVEVGVTPPFTALHAASKRLIGSRVVLCAQDVYYEAQGAYTGEISAAMLADVGCRYTIVGHSERRARFGETNESAGKKVGAALKAGLRVILCVGETLEQREAGAAIQIVSAQLEAGLAEVTPERAADLVLAYEPVWAIGTGKTATPSQAQEVHAHLRSRLGALLGADVADTIRIQYGGSVKPENARDLFTQPDIDGGLIGGAALVAKDFLAICRAAVP